MGIIPGDLAFHGDKNSVATVALRRTLVDRAAVAHTDACLTISLGLAISHVSADRDAPAGVSARDAAAYPRIERTADAMAAALLDDAAGNPAPGQDFNPVLLIGLRGAIDDVAACVGCDPVACVLTGAAIFHGAT